MPLKLDDYWVRDKIYRARQRPPGQASLEGVVSRLQEIQPPSRDMAAVSRTVLSHPGPGMQYEPKMPVVLAGGFAGRPVAGAGQRSLAGRSGRQSISAMLRKFANSSVVPVAWLHIPVLDLERSERMQRIVEGMPRIVSRLWSHSTTPRAAKAKPIAEVRTAYFNTKGRNIGVIQITSPDPSDGKTTLSTNLSVSIASVKGKRVLLIDFRLRSPRSTACSASRPSAGVAQVIVDEIPLSEGHQAHRASEP